MTAMETVWALAGLAALVLILVFRRKFGVAGKLTTFTSGLTSVSSTTPGWLAFLKLLWIWCANAVGSLVLWILAVPGSGRSAAFSLLGWIFLVGNVIGVLVTLALFASDRRSDAVQTAKWVVPAIFAVILIYGLFQFLVA